jgi:hypothetical protein
MSTKVFVDHNSCRSKLNNFRSYRENWNSIFHLKMDLMISSMTLPSSQIGSLQYDLLSSLFQSYATKVQMPNRNNTFSQWFLTYGDSYPRVYLRNLKYCTNFHKFKNLSGGMKVFTIGISLGYVSLIHKVDNRCLSCLFLIHSDTMWIVRKHISYKLFHIKSSLFIKESFKYYITLGGFDSVIQRHFLPFCNSVF